MKSLALAAMTILFAPPAFAAPYALPDEYLYLGGTVAQVSTTASAAAPATPAPTASPVPAKKASRHGYFYLAYALVWGGIAAYVAYLAGRIAAIEARLTRRP